jgi:hypothetical protein
VNAGVVAFLAGLFGIPLLLLAWGHRLRRLEPWRRRAFWGAVFGHCIAAILALTFGMIPPESWTAQETLRGFFGFWALLLFPLAGGVAGILTNR